MLFKWMSQWYINLKKRLLIQNEVRQTIYDKIKNPILLSLMRDAKFCRYGWNTSTEMAFVKIIQLQRVVAFRIFDENVDIRPYERV